LQMQNILLMLNMFPFHQRNQTWIKIGFAFL
jgi:hypothetical protein